MNISKKILSIAIDLVIIFCFLFAFFSCNPVKKVLKSKAKTEEVVEAYINYIDSSTTQKQTTTDTIYVDSGIDTLYLPGEKLVTKKTTVYIYDTTIIFDVKPYRALQKLYATSDSTLKETKSQLKIKQANLTAYKWKFYAFVIGLSAVVLFLLFIIFKIKS